MVQILFAVVGTLLIRGEIEISNLKKIINSWNTARNRNAVTRGVQWQHDPCPLREGLARRSRLLDRDAHLVPFRALSPKFDDTHSTKAGVARVSNGGV